MAQSLKAVKIDGLISIIVSRSLLCHFVLLADDLLYWSAELIHSQGFVGGAAEEKEPSFLEALMNICTVRGVCKSISQFPIWVESCVETPCLRSFYREILWKLLYFPESQCLMHISTPKIVSPTARTIH